MTGTRCLTPPEVAKRYGIDAHKVLTWIQRGELRAVNIADHVGGRPRWRIAPEDLAAFEASRSSSPQPKVTRIRRRRDTQHVVEFF